VDRPRPIGQRLAEAKAKMIASWRVPRAFYLNREDHGEFMDSSPVEVKALFRGKVRREPGFDGVAVRQVTGERTREQRGTSILYCSHGTGVSVPAR
jgi:hypothetical protein